MYSPLRTATSKPSEDCLMGTRDVISCNPLVPENKLSKIQVNLRTKVSPRLTLEFYFAVVFWYIRESHESLEIAQPKPSKGFKLNP